MNKKISLLFSLILTIFFLFQSSSYAGASLTSIAASRLEGFGFAPAVSSAIEASIGRGIVIGNTAKVFGIGSFGFQSLKAGSKDGPYIWGKSALEIFKILEVGAHPKITELSTLSQMITDTQTEIHSVLLNLSMAIDTEDKEALPLAYLYFADSILGTISRGLDKTLSRKIKLSLNGDKIDLDAVEALASSINFAYKMISPKSYALSQGETGVKFMESVNRSLMILTKLGKFKPGSSGASGNVVIQQPEGAVDFNLYETGKFAHKIAREAIERLKVHFYAIQMRIAEGKLSETSLGNFNTALFQLIHISKFLGYEKGPLTLEDYMQKMIANDVPGYSGTLISNDPTK